MGPSCSPKYDSLYPSNNTLSYFPFDSLPPRMSRSWKEFSGPSNLRLCGSTADVAVTYVVFTPSSGPLVKVLSFSHPFPESFNPLVTLPLFRSTSDRHKTPVGHGVGFSWDWRNLL